MKKVLIAAILSLMVTSSVIAADTYTESLLNSVQKKIDTTAAPVVNREKQIRAQQQAFNPQNRAQDAQAQQQALINKKKQQIQNQKDLFNNEKNEIKNIFLVK